MKEKEPKSDVNSLQSNVLIIAFMDFAIAAFAGVCAGLFTNPLDVLKVRMQLQNELQKKGQIKSIYKNVFHAACVIAKKDGLLALQKGLVPALWVQLIFNGVRLGTYEYGYKHGYLTNDMGELIFYKNILLSSIGGILGVYLSSPVFMIKTQFMAENPRNLPLRSNRHTWNALSMVYRNHGIKGLFRGAVSSMPRAVVASTSQLTSFTYSKELLTKCDVLSNFPYLKSFISGFIGGTLVSIMVAPFDLISIRLYNQGVDSQGRGLLYKNFFDCAVKTYKAEGILGLYKGIGPNYARLSIHTVLCLVFWDFFKTSVDRLLFSTQT